MQPYPASNPGTTLGVISIVLLFLGVSLVGIILGFISRNQSKAVGASTTLGTVGVVLNSIALVLGTIIFILFFVLAFASGYNESTGSGGYQQVDSYDSSSIFSEG